MKTTPPIKRCIYCGSDEAITRDHIVPCAWKGFRTYDKGDVVPCCSECNTLLNDTALFTIEERAAYLYNKLSNKKKTKEVLRTPMWTSDELEDMDDSFKSMIKANLVAKAYMENRLKQLRLTARGSIDEDGIINLNFRYRTSNREAMMYLREILESPAKTLPASINTVAEMFNEPVELMESIVKDKHYSGVRMVILDELGYPFDSSLTAVKRVISRNNK